MLINAGVRTVIYLDGYPDTLSLDMLREAGIAVTAFAGMAPVSGGGS
jgi:dCMP deaminase